MRQMMEEHADGQTFMEDGELFAYLWYTAPLTRHMCDTFLSEATEDEQGLVDILCEPHGSDAAPAHTSPCVCSRCFTRGRS